MFLMPIFTYKSLGASFAAPTGAALLRNEYAPEVDVVCDVPVEGK